MTPRAEWLLVPIGTLLALPPYVVRVSGRSDFLSATGEAAVCALLISLAAWLAGLGPGRSRCDRAGLLRRGLVTCGFCVLVPLAGDSLLYSLRAGAALFLTALGMYSLRASGAPRAAGGGPQDLAYSGEVTVSPEPSSLPAINALMIDGGRHPVFQPSWPGMLMAVVACALDATAIVLPAGLFIVAVAVRRGWGRAVATMSVALLAVAGVHAAEAPVFTGASMTGGVHALNRDVTVLLAPMVLGLAGWASGRLGYVRRGDENRASLELPAPTERRCRTGRDEFRSPEHRLAVAIVSAWMLAGLVMLLAGFLGMPIQPALAVLPCWFWAPRAGAELWGALRPADGPGLGRLVPVAMLALVGALLFAPAAQWWDNALLAMLLLTSGASGLG